MSAPDVSSIDVHLTKASDASNNLSLAIRAYLNAELAFAGSNSQDSSTPAWGDRVLKEIWTKLLGAGSPGPGRPLTSFAFAEAMEAITQLLSQPEWSHVHKGLHYYNKGLVLMSMMDVDRALKFFLLADEEDVRNNKADEGDVFRKIDIFQKLSDAVLEPWMQRTESKYTQGQGGSPHELRDRLRHCSLRYPAGT